MMANNVRRLKLADDNIEIKNDNRPWHSMHEYARVRGGGLSAIENSAGFITWGEMNGQFYINDAYISPSFYISNESIELFRLVISEARKRGYTSILAGINVHASDKNAQLEEYQKAGFVWSSIVGNVINLILDLSECNKQAN